DHPDAGERRVAVDHQILMGHEKYAGVHRGEEPRQPGMLVVRPQQIFLLHRLRLAQFLDGALEPALSLPTLRDVANTDANSQVAAAAVVDGPPVRGCPEFRAVLAPSEKPRVLPAVPAQR